MPKRPNESVLEFAMRQIRDEILTEAANTAYGNAPDNEPGEYWKGRRDAGALIERMLSEQRR